jgi:mRNA interferase MazF
MPHTTTYRFGDIVLVPFPFTDQTSFKKRPAVVVNSAGYDRARPDVILMAVTSQIHSPVRMGDVEIHLWREAGLLKPSTIKPILTTIEKGRVIRQLGRLLNADRRVLHEVLNVILGE